MKYHQLKQYIITREILEITIDLYCFIPLQMGNIMKPWYNWVVLNHSSPSDLGLDLGTFPTPPIP